MSPLGKLTLAIIGLRLLGAEGFFVGLMLGHFFIDRTHLITSLQRRLAIIDDNIRILLPFKYYHIYNQVEGHFWGKVWGALLGAILYGWYGFLVLFILGHFVFDTPDSRHAKCWRQKTENFFDAHWGKISGAIAGFVCRSDIILFCGVIVGFFIDYARIEKALWLPKQKWFAFWKKFNHLRWWKYSREAKHMAFVRAVAGLAAKVAKADGMVSEKEILAFRHLFEISDDESLLVAKIFNDAKKNAKDYEGYCRQLKKLTVDNVEMKETVIDNMFQIAKADGEVKTEAVELLAKIAQAIDLPNGNFEVIKKLYMPKLKNKKIQKCFDILGLECGAGDAEIRAKWKELIILYHPDRLQSLGASISKIEETTAKMAEINHAYQEIMKFRSVR